MPPALPVVRVVGPGRNVGKTLLASRLIARLSELGYRVGAVKHSHHPLMADRPGSDTDRFARAGAPSVLFIGPGGTLTRDVGTGSLEDAVRALEGEVDVAIVEGFKTDTLGAMIRIGEGDPRAARFETMDGEEVLATSVEDIDGLVRAVEARFQLSAAGDERLRAYVRRAAARHGHFCAGVTLGARMALAGLDALGMAAPPHGRRLHVRVEVARCATDAIASVTGCNLGTRTLLVDDLGKMAATFIDATSGRAVRVLARESARELVAAWAPGWREPAHRQAIAYRLMPDDLLFEVRAVRVPLPVDTRPPRVECVRCGEGVSFGRYVRGAVGCLCLTCALAAPAEPASAQAAEAAS